MSNINLSYEINNSDRAKLFSILAYLRGSKVLQANKKMLFCFVIFIFIITSFPSSGAAGVAANFLVFTAFVGVMVLMVWRNVINYARDIATFDFTPMQIRLTDSGVEIAVANESQQVLWQDIEKAFYVNDFICIIPKHVPPIPIGAQAFTVRPMPEVIDYLRNFLVVDTAAHLMHATAQPNFEKQMQRWLKSGNCSRVSNVMQRPTTPSASESHTNTTASSNHDRNHSIERENSNNNLKIIIIIISLVALGYLATNPELIEKIKSAFQ